MMSVTEYLSILNPSEGNSPEISRTSSKSRKTNYFTV